MRAALRCQSLLLRIAGLALLLGSVAQVVPAQGRVLTPCAAPRADVAVPRPCPSNVVRLATRTVVEVDGRVARTTITETFENRGGPLGEADVVYPLPSGAAFEELRLEINGELGSLRWDFEEMNLLHFYDATDPRQTAGWRRIMATAGDAHPYASYWPDAHLLGYEHTFVSQAADICRVLGGRKPLVPLPDFADAWETQRVLEAAMRSARERTAVKIAEVT